MTFLTKAILGFITLSTVGFASSLSVVCDDNTCFEMGIEYLYLKPTIHDPFFVIPERATNTNDPNGTRFANELGYHSGVRATATYNLSPCDQLSLFIEGAYLSDDHNRSKSFGTADPKALGTKGNPNADLDSVENVSSLLDYCFWNLKGGFHYRFYTPCPILFAANLNLHYVDLEMKENIHYDETNDKTRVDATQKSYAIGPEFGADFGYRLTDCLTLVTRGSFGLLVASHQSKTSSVEKTDAGAVNELVFADNDELNSITPAMELKMGLNYRGRFFNCLNAGLEVGFDVIRYSDLIDRIRWIGDGAESEGLSLDYFSPFMLHGLYIAVNATF